MRAVRLNPEARPCSGSSAIRSRLLLIRLTCAAASQLEAQRRNHLKTIDFEDQFFSVLPSPHNPPHTQLIQRATCFVQVTGSATEILGLA